MAISILPLQAAEAREILAWRYAPPYDLYNLNTDDVDAEVAYFLDPSNGFLALHDSDAGFVGFCCFGAEARVAGGRYDDHALDMGIGIKPDLTGQGHGAIFGQSSLNYAHQHLGVGRLRTTVAAFNMRSRRLCENLGFRETDTFDRPSDGLPFVIMIREGDNQWTNDFNVNPIR